MDTLTNGLGKISEAANLGRFGIPEAIIMLVAGLLLLFLGYRIKKVAFFIIWFILGFNLMGFLMPIINNAVPDISSNQLYQILLPIAGGLLLALLGFSIEKICVAGICFALVMMITIQYFGTEIPTLAIGAVVGVVLAALAVTLMKPATILATSFAGGYALTMGLLELNLGIAPEIFYWPILLGSALIGAIVQFSSTKHIS